MVLWVTKFRTQPILQPKPSRRRHASFDDLSDELKADIIFKLSVTDIYNIRLSGLIPLNSYAGQLIRNNFTKCSSELRELRQLAVLHGSKARMRAAGAAQFCVSDRLKLKLQVEGLPIGVRHLPNLRVLDISAKAAGPTISELPDALAECTKLTVLHARGHAFTAVPRVVLRCRRLSRLDLRGCTGLEKLPRKLGRRLMRLQYIRISGTPIQKLPRSMLRTLESNCKRIRQPLDLSPRSFSPGYLRLRIAEQIYPNLAHKCQHLFDANENADGDDAQEEEVEEAESELDENDVEVVSDIED